MVLTPLEADIFLKKAHRIYWDKRANEKGELWGVSYQSTWEYDFLSLYVDYFTNLRIGDLTNGSLMDFLNLDIFLANNLVNRAVEKAQKEMEEEKRRKEIEEQERRARKPAFRHRIKK